MDPVIPIEAGLMKLAAELPYTPESRSYAVRLGFCQALADHGLTPTDLSRCMAKIAEHEGSMISDALGLGTRATIAATVAAVILGSQTGKLHHHLEQRAEKADDPELVKLRQQAMALSQARNELQEDLDARALQPPTAAPPAKPKRTRKVQAPMSLLD